MNTLLLCLALTVFQEARGEPVQGQRAVATVILNRARIRGISPCDAVLEKGQFSWHPEKYTIKTHIGRIIEYSVVKDRLPLQKKGWKESVEAAEYALTHEDTLDNAEFFHATSVHPAWKQRCVVVLRVGNHVFYARKPQYMPKNTAQVAVNYTKNQVKYAQIGHFLHV